MSQNGRTASRAGVYCRISQDRDAKKEGVRRQEKDCRDLAQDLGWDVETVYVDNDVSASTGRPRPQFAQMLSDIESGAIDGVLAWHPDRLIRRPAELEDFIDLAERKALLMHTVKAGDYDLSTASGKMVARMLGAAARHETDRMSERIKRTKAQKAADGLWKGGSRPFGYVSVKGQAGHLAVVESEASVLRDCVDKFLAGSSLRSMARDLHDRGVLRTKGDSNWTTGDVGRMIGRPVSAGLVVLHGEVVGKGVWPAIVAEDRWRAVRTMLDDPARRVAPGRRPVNLLSGVALCDGPLDAGGTCGSTLMSNAGEYYRCSAGRDGRSREPGHHVYRKRSDLDAYARELVVARLSRDDAADLLTRSPGDQEDTVALQAEADALRQRLKDNAEMFATGAVTRVQMEVINARVKTDLETIDGRLAVAAQAKPTKVAPEFTEPERAEEIWESLTPSRRREIVRALLVLKVQPSKRRYLAPFNPSEIEIDWLA